MTAKQVREWLQSQIAYYGNFNDHGRVLRLLRLYFALFERDRDKQEVNQCIRS